MKTIKLALLCTLIAGVSPAFATNDGALCGNAPQEQWMSADAIKAKAVEAGYDVRQVKVEDGCYEIYGIDAKGARLEIMMNPVSGETVKVKTKN